MAAAAAVVLALVLTGVPGLSSDRVGDAAARKDRLPVEVAADFVDAFADYDAVRAAQDLAAERT